MKYSEIRAEILQCTDRFGAIGDSDIQLVSERLLRSPSGIARICYHGAQDSLQLMLVGIRSEHTYPIHRHNHKMECYSAVSGRGRVDVFDEKKNLSASFELDQQDNPFFFLAPGLWHSVSAADDTFIFIETSASSSDPVGDIEFG